MVGTVDIWSLTCKSLNYLQLPNTFSPFKLYWSNEPYFLVKYSVPTIWVHLFAWLNYIISVNYFHCDNNCLKDVFILFNFPGFMQQFLLSWRSTRCVSSSFLSVSDIFPLDDILIWFYCFSFFTLYCMIFDIPSLRSLSFISTQHTPC